MQSIRSSNFVPTKFRRRSHLFRPFRLPVCSFSAILSLLAHSVNLQHLVDYDVAERCFPTFENSQNLFCVLQLLLDWCRAISCRQWTRCWTMSEWHGRKLSESDMAENRSRRLERYTNKFSMVTGGWIKIRTLRTRSVRFLHDLINGGRNVTGPNATEKKGTRDISSQ